MVVRICISTPLYSETLKRTSPSSVNCAVINLVLRSSSPGLSLWRWKERHPWKSPGIEVEFMRCQIVSEIGWCPQLPPHYWHGSQQEFICSHLCYQSSLARNSLHINDIIDNISAKIFNSMGHISFWSSIVYCLKLVVESFFYRHHLHGWLEQRLCWFVPRPAPLPVGYIRSYLWQNRAYSIPPHEDRLHWDFQSTR